MKNKYIQWDGQQTTLDELLSKYPDSIRAWINNNNPKYPNALRINLIKYQGDYWVDIGDYIELGEDRVWFHQKDIFEQKLRE